MELIFVVVGGLAPFRALAIPIASRDPPMFSEPVIPESSHMDHKIVAGIVFVFGKANAHFSPDDLCSLRSAFSAFCHYRGSICMHRVPNTAHQVH
jgi:hypothetical protein